ncbi:hypothetical protein HRbin09_01632 [bacterium HR09]|nr:hypothetical protein HRbin09_01632 [bacterium HR09]
MKLVFGQGSLNLGNFGDKRDVELRLPIRREAFLADLGAKLTQLKRPERSRLWRVAAMEGVRHAVPPPRHLFYSF